MSPGEEGAGPWDRLTGLHLGPQAHTQPWKRAPCERHALSPEQRLSTPGTSGPWGPLTEQGGCGVPPEQGSPRPSHLTEAEQGGERGGHGVPSLRSRLWGWRRPGCPPDRQTTGRVLSGAGASCHAAFTSASPQEGEQPLLESLASSPGQSQCVPETPLPVEGIRDTAFPLRARFRVCFLLCPPISRSPWGPHRGWGHQALEMLRGGLRSPETHFF